MVDSAALARPILSAGGRSRYTEGRTYDTTVYAARRRQRPVVPLLSLPYSGIVVRSTTLLFAYSYDYVYHYLPLPYLYLSLLNRRFIS